MKQPHKHAELIKAWADGAEIEVWHPIDEEWVSREIAPLWYESYEYRIKPEPKLDVVESVLVMPLSTGRTRNDMPHNLRLTWDGETGKLKKAEVIG